MAVFFNADEIFRMAEQIEENGSHFYRFAAPGAPDSLGRLFGSLAAREEEHAKVFARMRAELSEEDRRETVLGPDEQAAAYLKAWADGHVFDARKNPVEAMTGKETVEDVLRMAMAIEKDSIAFYTGMKNAVPERLGPEKIDRIIREEMDHLATLSRELETMRHQIL